MLTDIHAKVKHRVSMAIFQVVPEPLVLDNDGDLTLLPGFPFVRYGGISCTHRQVRDSQASQSMTNLLK